MNTKGQGLDDNSPPVREQGKNYLFVIAIDKYRHSPPLYNCIRDMERMQSILHRDYQFEPDHTFALYNEKATEKNIFDTFKKLVQIVRPVDNLLILYSGHGEFEADIEEGYWIPVDAQLGDFSDYVSNGRIIKYLKSIKAHHILLIVDSCFSGSLFAQRNLERSRAELRLDDIPSRWLITAGRNEVVSDGKPGDHSPFADNIIYFLENNRQASLSVADLSDAVVEAVIYNSRQTPRGEPLQDVGHRGGQFFFHRKGHTPAIAQPRYEPSVKTAATLAGQTSGQHEEKTNRQPYLVWGLIGILGLLAIAFGIFLLLPRPAEEPALPGALGDQENDTPDLQAQPDPSSSTGDLILTPQSTVDEAPQADTPMSRVEKAWQSALATNTEAVYRRFIDRFPRSRRVNEAEQKIAANYRYELLFSPAIKQGNQLEVHFSNGKAPYRISLTMPNDDKIEKTWNSGQPFFLDLGTVPKNESGVNVIKIIVTDHNFKKKGHVLPVYN